MLITSSMQYADATDPAYIEETGMLMAGMRNCEMAVTMTWLARMAAQALIDKHQGSREAAEAELQVLAVTVLEAQSSLVEEGR